MTVVPEARPDTMAALEETGGMALLETLQRTSPQTVRHSFRVGELAIRLGEVMPEVPDHVARALGLVASLHDVGKSHPRIAHLIDLPRKFDEVERQKVRLIHTHAGSHLISGLKAPQGYESWLELASFAAFRHHDDMVRLANRNGADPSMIMTANLVHVVDVFDAMQDHERPYNILVNSPEEAAAKISEELEIPPIFGTAPAEIPDLLLRVAR